MKKLQKFQFELVLPTAIYFLQKVIFFFPVNINLCVRECYSILQLPKKTYKGEIEANRDQTKLYFVQYLGSLLSQIMQLRLSSSNEKKAQLLP